MEERCGAEGDQLPPDYGRGAASWWLQGV